MSLRTWWNSCWRTGHDLKIVKILAFPAGTYQVYIKCLKCKKKNIAICSWQDSSYDHVHSLAKGKDYYADDS